MSSPSKVVASFFGVIVLLVSLISLVNSDFSIFPIPYLFSFSEKPKQSSNVSNNPYEAVKGKEKGEYLKDVEKPNWVSRAISPNISKCFPADLTPKAITSTDCCPPNLSSSKAKDFNDFAPPNATIRVRKPAHLIDEEYIAKFEKGIALMRALPDDDPRNFIQQAKVHCAYCNGAYRPFHPFENTHIDIHGSWFFFPFHRWYIYFFERILGNLIGDPTFALPYWNWDSMEGMQMPSYFTKTNSSFFDELRHQKHLPPHVIDLNFDKNDQNISSRQQVLYNLAFMYKQMVLANTAELFMGSPFRLGDHPYPGLGSVEAAPHNTVHSWVGAVDTPDNEDMGTFYTAARDPIFFPHHSNLDRMWSIWKTLDGGRRDYSDNPDWLDSEFYFYDENANLVRVKVRDCLDTNKLGYLYEDADLPWLRVPPTSRKSKLLRQAKKGQLLSSMPRKFPLVLDSVTSTIVKRSKKLRSIEEKEQEEEVLVIQGIQFPSDKFVKFDVHVDDDPDNLSAPHETEFVASFVNLRHGHGHGYGHNINTTFKVGISKVLEHLAAEEDDNLLVTLVPKAGKGDVVIGSIKIEFIPK